MTHKTGRREFLTSAGALGAACMLGKAATGAEGTAGKRPDILLIMPDQMRGDCLSCLDHAAVRTPAFDALASEGALFRRAYATVPSCIPARYGMLSGLYPQTSGVVGFAARPFETKPFPQLLSEAGYETVLVGRWMHQPEESGACGYDREILGSTHVDNDQYDQFLQREAPQTGGIRQLISDLGLNNNKWPAAPWPLEERLHPTAWIGRHSREVTAETDPEQPLFLTASFYAPHPPLFPPKRLFDHYYSSDKLPPTAKGDWVDYAALSPEGSRNAHRILLEGDKLRRAQAGYYGLIEQIDEEMGWLIEDFKARSEQAGRPWLILMTSDHGEMLGDHGYFRKCEPYEGSANVPFIVAGSPELGFKQGLVNKQPVSLEDIMPTFLALAGVDCPAHVDGADLTPTLRGEDQIARDWLHFEHATCYSKEQAFHAMTDGRWKYIWRPHTGDEQLFDLEADLLEEHNLADDAAHGDTLKRWRQRMIQRLKDRPEGFVQDGELIAGRPYKPLNKESLQG